MIIDCHCEGLFLNHHRRRRSSVHTGCKRNRRCDNRCKSIVYKVLCHLKKVSKDIEQTLQSCFRFLLLCSICFSIPMLVVTLFFTDRLNNSPDSSSSVDFLYTTTFKPFYSCYIPRLAIFPSILQTWESAFLPPFGTSMIRLLSRTETHFPSITQQAEPKAQLPALHQAMCYREQEPSSSCK